MTDTSTRSRFPALLAVSVSLLALTAGCGSARAEISEIDSFQTAVTSQTAQDAVAFINAYPSSHLIGDLLDLLPPEIAQQVCTDLAGGAPAGAQSACNTLQRAYAVVPIEPAAGPAPAKVQLPEAQAPTTRGTSISALPAGDPASSQVIIRRGGKGKDDATYWLFATLPNARGAGDSSRGDASASGGNSNNANGAKGGGSPSGSADGTGSSASSSGNGGSSSNSNSSGGSPSVNNSGGGGSPSASGSGPSENSAGQGGGVLGSTGDAVGGIAGAVGGAVGDASNTVGGAVGSAGRAAGGAVGAAGHAVGNTVGAVGNAAGGLLGD